MDEILGPRIFTIIIYTNYKKVLYENTVIIEKGTHTLGAYVPDLPGCVAVADTEKI